MSTLRTYLARWIATAGVLLLLSAMAAADDPLIYTTIQPSQITLGESARFTITNLGDGSTPMTMPVVSGLQFEIVGRSRQIEIINGTTLPSTSIIVRVTPQMAGIFTIPGVTPKSQPLVLQVNAPPGSVGAPVPKAPRAPNPPPPILSGASVPKGVHLTEDGSAYVRLTVPKRDIYVGETIPVEVEVGMRSGFVSSLNGIPRLTGDNFTLSNLSREPERTEKLIDGQPFVLLTWHGDLAVVKPGTFALSAEVPLTVKIRTRSRRESTLDDQFGDPFWQNFFGATVPKDINVESPSQELLVQELPAAGRPADFHGAIGSFALESDVTPTKADVGDPLTLRMRIIGSGNFDRVDSPMLDRLEQWKTYPPKSTFNTTDPNGHKGEKLFEQPIIASKAGAQTLPALSFSYFNPATRRYETVRGAPLNVIISPSLADASSAPQADISTAPAASANKFAQGLKADHAATNAYSTLTPLYLQQRFLAIPSLLALAFAGVWAAALRRRDPARKTSPGGRAASREVRRALAQIEAAARDGNPASFFNAARLALQHALAVRWQVPPEQVTADEVRARLHDDADIQQVFALADESKYSGHVIKSTDFSRWMNAVRRLMTEETA